MRDLRHSQSGAEEPQGCSMTRARCMYLTLLLRSSGCSTFRINMLPRYCGGRLVGCLCQGAQGGAEGGSWAGGGGHPSMQAAGRPRRSLSYNRQIGRAVHPLPPLSGCAQSRAACGSRPRDARVRRVPKAAQRQHGAQRAALAGAASFGRKCRQAARERCKHARAAVSSWVQPALAGGRRGAAAGGAAARACRLGRGGAATVDAPPAAAAAAASGGPLCFRLDHCQAQGPGQRSTHRRRCRRCRHASGRRNATDPQQARPGVCSAPVSQPQRRQWQRGGPAAGGGGGPPHRQRARHLSHHGWSQGAGQGDTGVRPARWVGGSGCVSGGLRLLAVGVRARKAVQCRPAQLLFLLLQTSPATWASKSEPGCPAG